MIPKDFLYQIYLSLVVKNDYIPTYSGKLSQYTDNAHTKVKSLSSRYML